MNSNSPQSSPTLRLVLANDEGTGRIRVDMQSFVDFDNTLSEDLARLVTRWAHTAAPRSSRTTGEQPLPF